MKHILTIIACLFLLGFESFSQNKIENLISDSSIIAYFPLNNNLIDESKNKIVPTLYNSKARLVDVNGKEVIDYYTKYVLDRFNRDNSALTTTQLSINTNDNPNLFIKDGFTTSFWFNIDYRDRIGINLLEKASKGKQKLSLKIDFRDEVDIIKFFVVQKIDEKNYITGNLELSVPKIKKDKWNYLVCSYDNTNLNIQFNGEKISHPIEPLNFKSVKKYSSLYWDLMSINDAKEQFLFFDNDGGKSKISFDDILILSRAITNDEIGNLLRENPNKITNNITSTNPNGLNPGQLNDSRDLTSKELEIKNSQSKSTAENQVINPKLLELKKIISDNGCIVLTNYPDVISVSWSGTCKDSLANGKGILKYIKSNGDITIYEGETLNGYRNGKGTYNWTTGEKYEGEWKDDKANGIGIYTYPNGSKYEGQLSDGKKNGNGILLDNNGDKYEGEWNGDLRNGQGIYYWSNGSKYEGQFSNDKPNGKGIFTWTSGSKYIGQNKDGKRHGNGILIDVDGSKYEGEWQNDKKHGQGTYSIPDGTKYVGQFIDGYISGKGVQTDSKGEKYEGEWKYNSKEGYGTNTWPDGSKYEGEWVNGKANGQGAYIYPNGSVHFGEWKDNSLIKEAPRHKIVETNSKKESSESKNLEAFAAFMRSGNSSNSSTKPNNSSSNSSKSTQIQSQKCFECRGTGQCSDCSKPQTVRYKKGESPRNHNEIRLGMVICPQCGGNLMNWGADEKESCYLCKKWSGWVLCRKCNSNGDGRSIGKCQKCKGSGNRQ